MCGIIGYTGSKQVLPILIEGLSKLEYRGYDSAGIAIITTEKLLVKKEIGKLENLRKKLDNSPIKGHCGIGHTRWATHGGVTQTNAHPHTDCSGKLAIIHNGIIENYLDLKADLASKGHDFKSQTDSEIMAHLIEEELKSIQKGSVQEDISHPLALAVYRATKQAEGGFALVVVHHDYPGTMIVSRMHNPLIIGLGEGENLIASDVPALLEHTKKVYDLKNEEIALIDQDQVLLYDSLGRHTKMKTRQINWDAQQAQKGGYPHFLIKEIHETPEILTNALRGKVKGNKLNQEALGLADLDLDRINKVTFLACGSAAYACLYAKYLIEKWARITCEVFVGSEFRYHSPIIDQHTLIIAVSQSGETADTLASINLAKKFKPARIIGVINAIGSSMTREVDQVCHLQAGPEISVASTKALSSMLLTLALQALAIGQDRGELDTKETKAYLEELKDIPKLVQQVLQQEEEIARISTFFIHQQSAYFIGRDVNYPSALEGSQKLKELSYIHAEAYAAGELKHGANAVIHEGFPIICLAPKGSVYKKMISNIQQMKARDAEIFSIGTKGDEELAQHSHHTLLLPATSHELSVLLNTVAMQLFAYYTTLYKGFSIDNPRSLKKYYPKPGKIKHGPKSIDIDKPRNLAKSVTVE